MPVGPADDDGVSALLASGMAQLPLDLKPFLVLAVLVQEGRYRVVSFQACQFDLEAKVVGAIGVDEGLLDADLACLIELQQDVIERLTSFLDPLFHRFLQRIDFRTFDEVFDAGRVQHDFERRHPAAIQGGNQPLRDDGPQVQRQLQIDLRMSFNRKKVHDAFNGLVGVVRV